MNEYKKLGIKTKFIVNEGCIVGRTANMKMFPGYNNRRCCDHLCIELSSKEPWLNLCRINLYKESLSYYDIDILKFSTRDIPITGINELLKYWTMEYRTSGLYDIKITNDKYPIFLDWIKERSKCSNMCYECQKCKTYYTIRKHQKLKNKEN